MNVDGKGMMLSRAEDAGPVLASSAVRRPTVLVHTHNDIFPYAHRSTELKEILPALHRWQPKPKDHASEKRRIAGRSSERYAEDCKSMFLSETETAIKSKSGAED